MNELAADEDGKMLMSDKPDERESEREKTNADRKDETFLSRSAVDHRDLKTLKIETHAIL